MKKFQQTFKDYLRKKLNKTNQSRLTNTDVTIISSNCIGGVISHELGLQFRSPTVNLYIEPSDYVRFCSRLEYYMEQHLVQVDKETDYPIAMCGDVTIHGLHYANFTELNQKWEDRKKRINYDNLFIMMIERDGCTKEDIQQFDQLPYPNKVIFVSQEMPEIASAVYIPETVIRTDGITQVDTMVNYRGFFSGKRDIDLFDYVTFLNEGKRN